MPLPLLALGAGKFLRSLPLSVYLVVGVTAFVGVREWQHARSVNALREDLAAVAVERDAANTRAGEFKNEVGRVEANRNEWKQKSELQSAEIAQLQVTRQLVQQAAALAAVRTLEAGKATTADLLSPTTTVKPGHEGMNKFFDELGGAK